MSTFLKFLDISSFFIIIVINLSLIALLCYYVKRKFEHVEEIQNQQAKILFDLVNKPSGDSSGSGIDSMFLSRPLSLDSKPVDNSVSNISEDENKVLLMNDSEVSSDKYKTYFDEKNNEIESDNESDSDSDSDDDDEDDDEVEESEMKRESLENMVGVADKLLMSTHVEIKEESDDDQETVMDEDSDDSDTDSEEETQMTEPEIIDLPQDSIIEEVDVDEVSLNDEESHDVSEFKKFDEDFGDEFQSKVIHLGDDDDEVIQLGEVEPLSVEKENSNESDIEKMKVSELKALAEEKGIKLRSGMKKQDIINEMMKV